MSDAAGGELFKDIFYGGGVAAERSGKHGGSATLADRLGLPDGLIETGGCNNLGKKERSLSNPASIFFYHPKMVLLHFSAS